MLDIIKIDFKEIGCKDTDWIRASQDRDHKRGGIF
jgi:hypothetical protein